jgi:DNA modification methylase
MANAPGLIRDSIVNYLSVLGDGAPLADITRAVTAKIGNVPTSSIRSYLNLNVPSIFERTARGEYRLAISGAEKKSSNVKFSSTKIGNSELYHADCFKWLAHQEPRSIHAIVTDPPYSLLEYSDHEQEKLRKGKGGVWRVPPSFDGHQRSPLPRFTVLDDDDRLELFSFFQRLGVLLTRVSVPGANIVVASNPLLAHIVASAMTQAGLEMRGTIVRLTMTMRGGDRPKNAHKEFNNVSVMPRSMWEPWVVFRRPFEGRVQDNLRKWKTGGFRRLSSDKPFGDVIESRPTSAKERAIAPHPSLKPQSFLRHLVKAALPLEAGIILDPFAGSGSTLAAANAVGYSSIGVEADIKYVRVAKSAIRKLSSL